MPRAEIEKPILKTRDDIINGALQFGVYIKEANGDARLSETRDIQKSDINEELLDDQYEKSGQFSAYIEVLSMSIPGKLMQYLQQATTKAYNDTTTTAKTLIVEHQKKGKKISAIDLVEAEAKLREIVKKEVAKDPEFNQIINQIELAVAIDEGDLIRINKAELAVAIDENRLPELMVERAIKKVQITNREMVNNTVNLISIKNTSFYYSTDENNIPNYNNVQDPHDYCIKFIQDVINGNAELQKSIQDVISGNAELQKSIQDVISGNAELQKSIQDKNGEVKILIESENEKLVTATLKHIQEDKTLSQRFFDLIDKICVAFGGKGLDDTKLSKERNVGKFSKAIKNQQPGTYTDNLR